MSPPIPNPSNTLTSGQYSAVLANGRYDVDFTFIAGFRLGPSGITDDPFFFKYDCPGGEFSLRYNHTNTFCFLKVRGIDVLNMDPGVFPTSFMGWQIGDRVRIRVSVDPNAGARAICVRFTVNGGFCKDTVAADVGAALTSPTAGHLLVGSDGLTPVPGSTLLELWNDARHETTSLDLWADTLVLGDSILAPFLSTLDPAIAGMLNLPGRRVVTLASRGLNCGQESTLFGNSRCVNRDYRLRSILIQCGVNNVLGGMTGAQCITDMQTLITTLNTFAPNAKIFLFDMTPCYGFLSAPQITVFDAFQQAIRGGGGTPITGTGITRSSTVYNALVDPLNPGSIAPAYDSGDHLHPNMLGRSVMAPLFASALRI